MKTITEFSGSVLREAARLRGEAAEGSDPYATLGLAEDRLARLLEALELAKDRVGDVRRVRVMQLAEGEAVPHGAVKHGDHVFLIELPVAASPADRRGDRRQRRGRPDDGMRRDREREPPRSEVPLVGAGWMLSRAPDEGGGDRRRGRGRGGPPGDRRGRGGPPPGDRRPQGDRRGPPGGGPRGPAGERRAAPGEQRGPAGAAGPTGPAPNRPQRPPRPPRPGGPPGPDVGRAPRRGPGQTRPEGGSPQEAREAREARPPRPLRPDRPPQESRRPPVAVAAAVAAAAAAPVPAPPAAEPSNEANGNVALPTQDIDDDIGNR